MQRKLTASNNIKIEVMFLFITLLTRLVFIHLTK